MISEAEFAAASGVVAEVESPSGAFVSEDGDARLACEGVAGDFGSEGIGGNEEMRVADRLVVLGGGEVAGAEEKIVAPFATTMFYVHEGEANAGGEIEGGDPGTVHVDGEIDEGWAVGFFVSDDAEAGDSVLHEALVAEAVEAPFADEVSEAGVELVEIEITI